MLEATTQNLYEPNRQHPAAIAFILIKYLRRIGRMLIPLLVIVFIQSEDKALGYTLGVAIVFLVFQMVYAILEYFRYTFFIEGEELIIETGVLGRKRTGIPFDRIQTINFEQHVLHQVLNVVQVNVDTAGSAKTELNIHALGRKQAEELRSFVLSQKARLVEETEGQAVATDTKVSPGANVSSRKRKTSFFHWGSPI
jgi:putative membrane protein